MHEMGLSIFRRLIDANSGALTPSMAEAILQLQFSQADQERVSVLASKSNDGTLSAEEGQEYDGYIAAADLLALWQSKARLALMQHSSAA